jgi:hypothetical protein
MNLGISASRSRGQYGRASQERRLWFCVVLPAAVLLAAATTAWGDGGVVRLKQVAGPFIITIFTAPTPLRAGTVDLSVLVQRGTDEEPVLDAQVTMMLSAVNGAIISAAATHEQATNKLLYAALLNLPAPGTWQLQVAVRRAPESASVSCELRAAPPSPPLLAYWPYLALPPVVIGLFVVHQWLSRRGNGTVQARS